MKKKKGGNQLHHMPQKDQIKRELTPRSDKAEVHSDLDKSILSEW